MGSKRRVLVALSGGVDSAVSALLLKQRGQCHVEGVFMHNWDARDEQSHGESATRQQHLQQNQKQDSSTTATTRLPSDMAGSTTPLVGSTWPGGLCTADQDWASVQQTAQRLDMPVHRVNFVREYWHGVFEDVLQSYQAGATPNPDVLCNRVIKFGALVKWAKASGFDALATGHYAGVREDATGRSLALLQATHLAKDQSYFLSGIDQGALQSAIFPLSTMTKTQVRGLAQAAGLEHVLRRRESMGLCFVGRRRHFGSFLSQYLADVLPGDFVDLDSGSVIGRHTGLPYYTIGQCASLPGQSARTLVARKDPATNRIYVVKTRQHPALYSKEIYVKDINWIAGSPPPLSSPCSPGNNGIWCTIRSTDKVGGRARLLLLRDSDDSVGSSLALVRFDTAQFASAAGQWAVFYAGPPSPHGERVCLGGGLIVDHHETPPLVA